MCLRNVVLFRRVFQNRHQMNNQKQKLQAFVQLLLHIQALSIPMSHLWFRHLKSNKFLNCNFSFDFTCWNTDSKIEIKNADIAPCQMNSSTGAQVTYAHKSITK